MSSETTMAAEQCRLREWAAQISDCQNRPPGMSVVGWCAFHARHHKSELSLPAPPCKKGLPGNHSGRNACTADGSCVV